MGWGMGNGDEAHRWGWRCGRSKQRGIQRVGKDGHTSTVVARLLHLQLNCCATVAPATVAPATAPCTCFSLCSLCSCCATQGSRGLPFGQASRRGWPNQGVSSSQSDIPTCCRLLSKHVLSCPWVLIPMRRKLHMGESGPAPVKRKIHLSTICTVTLLLCTGFSFDPSKH